MPAVSGERGRGKGENVRSFPAIRREEEMDRSVVEIRLLGEVRIDHLARSERAVCAMRQERCGDGGIGDGSAPEKRQSQSGLLACLSSASGSLCKDLRSRYGLEPSLPGVLITAPRRVKRTLEARIAPVLSIL